MNKLVLKKKNELTQGKKKGFTLVELIIVIAIIAILAAIAIPKFGTIKQDANNKANIATGKTIATLVAKGIASDEIADSTTGKVELTALPKGSASTKDVDISSQIDGGTTPRGGGKFKVTIATGNIEVFVVKSDTDEIKVFPHS